ncbi:hypothetical protein [Parafrankia colletiae]|nr:hypothetical protein [Parafrankia colletiae]
MPAHIVLFDGFDGFDPWNGPASSDVLAGPRVARGLRAFAP